MSERLTQVALEVLNPIPPGMRLTQVALEVIIPASCGIACIILDLCIRAGLECSQVNVALLTSANLQPNNTCIGYVIDRATSAADAIRVIMEAYFIDACESGGQLKFVPRGLPAQTLTIPESDLGLVSDDAEVIPEQFGDEQDLPLECIVTYTDIELDYQSNSQRWKRNSRIVTTKQQKQLSYPLVMTPDQAINIAAAALYWEWVGRQAFDFNDWRAVAMLYDPTDVIQFIYETITWGVRITDHEIGQGFVSKFKTLNEEGAIYKPLPFGVGGSRVGNGAGIINFKRSALRYVGPPQTFLFDIPLLRDGDSNPSGTGYYFGLSSTLPQWAGAALMRSADNSTYTQDSAAPNAIYYGYATNALGSPASPWVWDNANSLTIALKTPGAALAGVTQLQILNGANALIVGSAANGWEIMQFENAVQNMDGTWTVSGLLRGRRGTEWACGTHAIGDLVVVPISGIQRVQNPSSLLNQPYDYRGVSVGQDVTSGSIQQFTLVGNDLKPYAPCQVTGSRDMSGDLTIAWVRRTRIGGDAEATWLGGLSEVPLYEQEELYEVDIYNGSVIVRQITGLISPTTVYSAADQTADFGSVQSSIHMKIYQVSAVVNLGFPATVTL